ncbi:MAG: hypothetical protein ACOC80_10350 [Petrotogales bacterium]
MIDLRITLSRHPISCDEFSGMVESIRGWDFVSDVSLIPDSSQLNPAQPQETEERTENSPASPVQHAQPSIVALAEEYIEVIMMGDLQRTQVRHFAEWAQQQQASAQ